MKKWYEGLEAHEIKEVLSNKASQVIYSVEKALTPGQAEKESSPIEREFLSMLSVAVDKIVDIKTAYYMYNKGVYKLWDEVHREILTIKNDMDNAVLDIYNQKEWI